VENFRKSIKFRKTLYYIFVLIVTLLNITQRFFDFGFAVSETVWNFGFGLMTGADAVAIYSLIIYTRALRDESKLQEMYIAETDERNILIRTKTGGTAVKIIMAVLVCAALVAGVFNEVVFFTLIATLLFIAVLKGVLEFYYKKKI
jgi:hypothetical protein